MKLSNIIEEFIKEMLEEQRVVELQRNELANQFNCVPSQINYVISTRFSPERGYSVESRRGGGGYIRITKVAPEDGDVVMHTINRIGDFISAESTRAILQSFYASDLITEREANLIMAALSDKALMLKAPERDIVRASILKNILINLL